MATLRRWLLVIDDDTKITDLFTELFRERYEVEVAGTGLDGLTAVLRRRPDVVLLDINMPGMSGLEVLKDIRKLDQRIPVIMVTANDDLAATEQVLKSGAFAYLPKPFQIPYALHLVEAALFEAPKPRSARGPSS
jgi:DNA-binding response OmpR family regulator